MNTYNLDATNLLCPMPVIKVQDKIRDLASGDILEVTCTDPGALSDIPSWCRMFGHKVLRSIQSKREILITIEVTHA